MGIFVEDYWVHFSELKYDLYFTKISTLLNIDTKVVREFCSEELKDGFRITIFLKIHILENHRG